MRKKISRGFRRISLCSRSNRILVLRSRTRRLTRGQWQGECGTKRNTTTNNDTKRKEKQIVRNFTLRTKQITIFTIIISSVHSASYRIVGRETDHFKSHFDGESVPLQRIASNVFCCDPISDSCIDGNELRKSSSMKSSVRPLQ